MMKSNFLNLPSSDTGDARRHVPFRSIINKHISILFVLSFVFSILFSYLHPVAALADPQPEYDPVYNTEIIRLTDYVDNQLTPDQQDVFYIMFGAYLVAQGAMQDNLLEDPYTTQDGVLGWLKSCGIQIYNSAIVQNALVSPSILVSEGIQDLVNYGMGLAVKAGLISDKVTWLNDVMSSDFYFLPYNQGLQIGINQVLASNGGLYDWQYHDYDFVSNFSWNSCSASGIALDEYNAKLSLLGFPRILVNSTDSQFNGGVISPNFKFDLLINNVDYSVRAVNVPSSRFDYVFFRTSNNVTYNGYFSDLETNVFYFNPNNYSNYVQVAQDALNYRDLICKGLTINYRSLVLYFPVVSLLNKVYVGTSINNATELSLYTDLNFAADQSEYYLQLQNDYLLDLKGLIQDLINVTVLKPVIYDNIYDPFGNQVTPVTNQVAVTVSLPDSGISIPTNLFSPLTKEGGYISYLWYMTKPLVQYTSDLVQTLVFPDDTGEGFDVTGPGAIVFGVISLGLIGGLVVKCLL